MSESINASLFSLMNALRLTPYSAANSLERCSALYPKRCAVSDTVSAREQLRITHPRTDSLTDELEKI